MSENSMDWTIQQALAEVQSISADQTSEDCPDCLMIVALWNSRGRFDTKFWNVGMKVSEMIALLEVQKQKLIKYMEEDK
jgi:hypothetical protein